MKETQPQAVAFCTWASINLEAAKELIAGWANNMTMSAVQSVQNKRGKKTSTYALYMWYTYCLRIALNAWKVAHIIYTFLCTHTIYA